MGEKHPVWKSGGTKQGYVGHPFGQVVGQIERLASGQGVKHVAKTHVDMITISYGAYNIGPKNFFPFPK